MKCTNRAERGEKSLLRRDPGSGSRLGEREKRRANKWDGKKKATVSMRSLNAAIP